MAVEEGGEPGAEKEDLAVGLDLREQVEGPLEVGQGERLLVVAVEGAKGLGEPVFLDFGGLVVGEVLGLGGGVRDGDLGGEGVFLVFAGVVGGGLA